MILMEAYKAKRMGLISSESLFDDAAGKRLKAFAEFNKWDEEWEVGSIDGTTGQNSDSTTLIRSKNYIPVVPGQTYYIGNQSKIVINVHKYGSDKSYLGNYNYTNSTMTIPSNVYYLRLRFGSAYGNSYKEDTCVNISKTTGSPKNGDYVPYNG